ncbi:Sensor-type histidine kinase PrrB [Mycobacterium talmoniae]|uniref:Sensor-type histidine kinase PrrB n=1 Tax=Mycobacterium talmoniae TaxID=1858794 RepID=A0A2S8BDH9_9MYCO|nr:Sensor-type histidine kinase PrrB [Mycobacterium talmoniae]
MNLLSRIFTRTPSLRSRVVLAVAIGTAIAVLITGAIVWVGITRDRKERLDRRLDEAAGFAIPFVSMGEIPRAASAKDAVITVRKGDDVTSNSAVVLPPLPAATPTPTSTGCVTGCAPSTSPVRVRARWRSATPTTPPSPTPTTCTAG